MFVRIERAEIEQANIIGQIHSEAWKQTYKGMFPEGFLKEDSVEKREKEFLESFHKTGCFYYVIYADVASVGIIKMAEEAETYEVESFYILEQYRNNGFGKQALMCLKEELGKKKLGLWVLEENKKARRFYENNDFKFNGDTRMIDRGQACRQLRYEL